MHQIKKDYTHFLGLPFIRQTQRTLIFKLQSYIKDLLLQRYSYQNISQNKVNLSHISLCMITLDSEQEQRKAQKMMLSLKTKLQQTLDHTCLSFSRLKYFSRYNQQAKRSEVSVIYLQIDKDDHFGKVVNTTNILTRGLLNQKIIKQYHLKRLRISYNDQEEIYKCDNYHLTLFRLNNVEENQQFKDWFAQITHIKEPLKLVCDFVDISTRFHYDSTGFYRPLSRILLQSKL